MRRRARLVCSPQTEPGGDAFSHTPLPLVELKVRIRIKTGNKQVLFQVDLKQLLASRTMPVFSALEKSI